MLPTLRCGPVHWPIGAAWRVTVDDLTIDVPACRKVRQVWLICGIIHPITDSHIVTCMRWPRHRAAADLHYNMQSVSVTGGWLYTSAICGMWVSLEGGGGGLYTSTMCGVWVSLGGGGSYYIPQKWNLLLTAQCIDWLWRTVTDCDCV